MRNSKFSILGYQNHSLGWKFPNIVVLYFCIHRNTEGGLLNVMGAMYGAVMFVGISNCSTVQPVVAVERTVFYRERAAGMYSALPYAFAHVR